MNQQIQTQKQTEIEKVYTINPDGTFTLTAILKNRFYYEYNEFGQLILIRDGNTNSSPMLEEYTYDPNGNRIKIYNHEKNETVYTPFREFMMIINNSGTFNYTYIYDSSVLVAKINPDGSKWFYHADHLGSTTLITNESGDIVEENFYLPYGLVDSGGESEIKLYEGKELDDTGQYYYETRYYDPTKRIFVQPDSLIPNVYDPQQLNIYAFERNSPYTYTDSTGEAAVWIHYADTFESYWTAGYSVKEAHQIAIGSVAPDFREYEDYYHEFEYLGSENRDLKSDYQQFVAGKDLTKMGEIEHAFYDVGTSTTLGYHSTSNPYFVSGGDNMLQHWLSIDTLSIGVDREGLQKEQQTRAKESAEQHGTESGNIERGIKSAVTKFIKDLVPGI